MSGFRAYCDFADFGGGENVCVGGVFRLSPEESRHLCGSLRASNGESADVFDMRGNVFECSIVSANTKGAELSVVARKQVREPSVGVFVAQCLPKGAAFEEIIRQSVEIGASGIFPIASSRSVVHIGRDDSEKKARKWNCKCMEAVKQSANLGSFLLPQVADFSEFLKKSADFDAKVVASLRPNAEPILKVLSEKFSGGAKRACILIGPEGDLSDAEYDAAERAGFLPVKLGDNVMKCETAAMSALAVVKSFFAGF